MNGWPELDRFLRTDPRDVGCGEAMEVLHVYVDLVAALRRAVDTELTARQREVFVAIVVNDVPLDALALRLGSSRNAVYKMMFDARRKLRAALAANGYLDDDDSGRS